MERNYPILTVTEKAARALRQGHPWVYADEILSGESGVSDGALADVATRSGHWLGTGYFNSASKIRVRVITRNKNDVPDAAFWQRRVRYAVDYRRAVMGEDFHACRLIFGEADGFPGLTVDRFDTVLAVQVLSLAMEQWKTVILTELVAYLRGLGEEISAVHERSEGKLRRKEGLTDAVGFLLDTTGDGHVLIRENGVTYDVDYINGQKTGFFLDQKYNRRAAARLAKGRRVLDCFTHTGAFGLNCALAGAESVVSVDVSADALEQAKKNAALTGVADRVEYLQSDVFDLLTKLAEEKRGAYDYIILDPPAFTKSRATVKSAERGYREINFRAMKLLPQIGRASCRERV